MLEGKIKLGNFGIKPVKLFKPNKNLGTTLELPNLYSKTSGRKYISKEKWWHLFYKQKGKCKKCGKKFSSSIKPHLDHKKPISRGGAKTKLSNLQLLCAKCNLKKSDKFGKRNKGKSRRSKNPLSIIKLPKFKIHKLY